MVDQNGLLQKDQNTFVVKYGESRATKMLDPTHHGTTKQPVQNPLVVDSGPRKM